VQVDSCCGQVIHSPFDDKGNEKLEGVHHHQAHGTGDQHPAMPEKVGFY
jgi:hypothetical protein